MGGFSSASATAIALVVLAGCCVLVRLLIRIAFVHHVGPDDYLITLAWAASMALAVVTGQQNHHVSSADQSEEQQVRLATLLRQLWSSNMTYSLAVLLLKDSLLFQYLRFSIDVGYRRACWAMGAIITIYGVSAFFVSIFSCQPIAYSWNSNIHGGKCIDFLAFWLFNASFNSATDIIVCALPIPVLKALQLPRKQMAILTCIFVLGAFVCIASIIRLFAVYGATVHNKDDPAITIWSAVEVNLGIICACLPSLRHPITQFSPRILALHHRRTAHETGAQSHRSNSNSTSTTLKYPEAVVTCIDRSLSPGGSLQNGIELTASQDRNTNATASDGTTSRSCTNGEDDEGGSAETSHRPFLTMSDRKGSWPTISTVTEYDVEEMDTDTTEEDASLQPQPLAPIPRAHLPPSRPLGPRPPVVQTKSPGPPPVQAAPPPPPVVVPRSQKRSKSKNKGPSRPVFPLACIPESSAPNTPVDDTCPNTSPSTHGYVGNGERNGQAQENEQMQQQQDQNQNHEANTSTDNFKPKQQQEPTIIIPPANPLEQQYYNHSQSQTEPLQAPDSPTSTYTSTSITTISSYSYGNNNNNTNHNNSHIAPWVNQEQSSNNTENEKRCACRASKTYSYEILGGPQALRELQESESNSTCCPRPVSDHRRPTSPLAKMRSLTKSKQQPASPSPSTPSASPSKQRTTKPSQSTIQAGSAGDEPVTAETAGLGVNLGFPVSSPHRTMGTYQHHQSTPPIQAQTQTQVPSTAGFYDPVITHVKQQQKQQSAAGAAAAVIIQDKYAREEQRRNLERARRKQREREREAERQRERAMRHGELSSPTTTGAGLGVVRPLGPRQMR